MNSIKHISFLSAVALATVFSVLSMPSEVKADCEYANCGYEEIYTNSSYDTYGWYGDTYDTYGWYGDTYDTYGWYGDGYDTYDTYGWYGDTYDTYDTYGWYGEYTYTDYPYTDYSYTDYPYTDYSYTDYPYWDSTPVYNQPYDNYYTDYSFNYNDYWYSTPTYNPPTYNPPRHDRAGCIIEASDRRVEEGDFVTITWDAWDADHASLTGFGSVSPNGGSERIRITDDETFTLRVEGRGGNDSCSVSVDVERDTPPPSEDLWCRIEASDRSIEDGDDITLTWESRGADEAHINQGIGEVSRNGSKRVSPSRDTSYTLTVEDDRGREEDCTVKITVEEEDENDLWCELEASDRSIEEGDRVRLTWDTRGEVRDARINQGVGSVDEDGGSEYVYPTRDTRYTLTIEDRDGDEEDCSVTIDVEDGLAPPPDVPLVYLSQLPYTGAGDGPMYWILLITGAGLLGYGLFFRALPFAYARLNTLRSDMEVVPAGEQEVVPQNVTRQDVRAFVSAIAEGDTTSAREFALTGGAVLFSEAAVILDDVVRSRENGAVADPMVKDMTKGWDASKFATLIEAFANAKDESVVEKVIA